MVIGNGLLAQTFNSYKDDDEILIFASGVSNSTETDSFQFKREFELLKKTIEEYPNHKLVYFSTVSIEDSSVNNRPYVQHKMMLEDYIQQHTKTYLVFRISNVVGVKGNEHTILNYLVNAVKNELQIDLWKNAERNLIDADDLAFIVKSQLAKTIENKIVNVGVQKSLLVIDIVNQIEKYLNKKAIINLIDEGMGIEIDVSIIAEELKSIELKKGSGKIYVCYLLEKYY